MLKGRLFRRVEPKTEHCEDGGGKHILTKARKPGLNELLNRLESKEDIWSPKGALLDEVAARRRRENTRVHRSSKLRPVRVFPDFEFLRIEKLRYFRGPGCGRLPSRDRPWRTKPTEPIIVELRALKLRFERSTPWLVGESPTIPTNTKSPK